MRVWETYDKQSFGVYNDQFSLTYYAPDGWLSGAIYRPFEASRVALEEDHMSVTVGYGGIRGEGDKADKGPGSLQIS
jgi:hypothetical protein